MLSLVNSASGSEVQAAGHLSTQRRGCATTVERAGRETRRGEMLSGGQIYLGVWRLELCSI